MKIWEYNLPLKPPHPCATPGCRALVYIGNHCDVHRPARESARRQGYDSRWDRYSKQFLREHPFCEDPFHRHPGQLIEATVTGHKQAHRGDATLLWNPMNHYPLCASCNAYQCAKFEGGFGNMSQRVSHDERMQIQPGDFIEHVRQTRPFIVRSSAQQRRTTGTE